MLNVAKNRDEHFLLYSVFMNLGTYNLMNFHNKSRCLKTKTISFDLSLPFPYINI